MEAEDRLPAERRDGDGGALLRGQVGGEVAARLRARADAGASATARRTHA